MNKTNLTNEINELLPRVERKIQSIRGERISFSIENIINKAYRIQYLENIFHKIKSNNFETIFTDENTIKRLVFQYDL